MNSNCRYYENFYIEPLILEPEDWSEPEWNTILKLFGMVKAERIVVSDYRLETYGLKKSDVVITDDEWTTAINHLNAYIAGYAELGAPGSIALHGVLLPLKKRFDNSERTYDLYCEIMSVE